MTHIGKISFNILTSTLCFSYLIQIRSLIRLRQSRQRCKLCLQQLKSETVKNIPRLKKFPPKKKFDEDEDEEKKDIPAEDEEAEATSSFSSNASDNEKNN